MNNQHRTKQLPRPCRRAGWIIPLALVASACVSTGQGTTNHITFDGPPDIPGRVSLVRQYEEANISLVAVLDAQGYGGFERVDRWRTAYRVYNGTAYVRTFGASPVAITSVSGQPYALLAVDLAEVDPTLPHPARVEFVGYRADGSTVRATFNTDGIGGVPGVSDFQTFHFGPEFSGLTRVLLPGAEAALDNLYVSIIPEPASSTLFGLGMLGIMLMRQRLRIGNELKTHQ
jgi:hypothetical protein